MDRTRRAVDTKRPGFVARWWLLIPMTIGAAIWWIVWLDTGWRLWRAVFG